MDSLWHDYQLMRFGFLTLVLMVPAFLPAQESTLQPYCQKIGNNRAHGPQLTAACEFVESLHYRLPDVLCTENIERYEIVLDHDIELRDRISAQVTHTISGDSYSNIVLNGNSVNAKMSDLLGMWSSGEFGTDSAIIFEPQSQAEFQFLKKASFHGTPTYVFAFHVARIYSSWSLNLQGHETHPGLKGKVFISVQDSSIRRFEVEADELTGEDYFRRFDKKIDFSEQELGDGSKFVLPTHSELTICAAGSSHCSRSLTQFANCHKFAAKSRIVTGEK